MADQPDAREEREHYAAKHERFKFWMDWTLDAYGLRRMATERSRARVEAFLATRPPADRYRLAEYIDAKKRGTWP